MNPSISFGTDGIRGRVGAFPFTERDIARLAAAIAEWAKKRYVKQSPRFLIGHDTRESCYWITPLIINILHQAGCSTDYAGTIPTPAILAAIQKDSSFDAGIVVSASHNLYHDNGIKLFDAQHGKISTLDEKDISELFNISSNLESVDYSKELIKTDYHSSYLDAIKTMSGSVSFARKKIVIDCAHGAVTTMAQELFESLGAETIVVNAHPTGKNINEGCGAVHPEGLRDAVLTHNAWVGLAFDGDGDRLVIVNRHGAIKDGDDVLALLVMSPEYSSTPAVVGTVVSNLGFEHFLESLGKKLLRAAVGEKHVAKMLVEENLILGGEPSGHTIVRRYLNAGDALFAAVAALKSALINNNQDLETFVRTPQYMTSFRVTERKDLNAAPLADIITTHEQQLTQGRILVRYSGTEPVIRVMVEDPNAEAAQTTMHSLCASLQKAFNT